MKKVNIFAIKLNEDANLLLVKDGRFLVNTSDGIFSYTSEEMKEKFGLTDKNLRTFKDAGIIGRKISEENV